MATRTFGSFTFEDFQDLFNIKKQKQLPLLTEWITIENNDNIAPQAELAELKNELLDYILEWNEDELKLFFIGPVLRLVHLNTEHFKPFSQRMLSATINGISVSGRVDFMIAKGLKTAKPPYFCIHEYKQEIDFEGDPLGQVLIAMLTAQTLNENKFPVLGAYIVGRNWFFLVLDNNNQYAVSHAYDASSDDIFQIFAILQKSKEIILRFI